MLLIFKFAKVPSQINGVKFVKVNGDDFEDIIDEYEIFGYPTFALFRDSKMLDTHLGKIEESGLKKFIQSKI